MSSKECFGRQLAIVAPLMCLLAVPAMAQLPVGVNVSYAIVGGDVTLNEPVFLVLSVENHLSEPVSVDLGMNYDSGFRAKLTRPDGKVVDRSRPAARGSEIVVPGVEFVPPLNTFAKRLLLNKWFVFDAPGRYALDVELTIPILVNPSLNADQYVTRELDVARTKPILVNGVAAPSPTAGHVEFTVRERNPTHLTALCEELQRRAAVLGLGRRDAKEALSYVNDPVAVPYLKAMLGGNADQDLVIDGLARVGDAAAVEALISQTDHPDLPTRTRVIGALIQIARRSEDEALRQRIRDVLLQVSPGAAASISSGAATPK